ncbi:MAG: HNH endonuclease [Desulfobacterales bacterium]
MMFEIAQDFLKSNILTDTEFMLVVMLSEAGDEGLNAIEVQSIFGLSAFVRSNWLIAQVGKKYLKFANLDLSLFGKAYKVLSDPDKNYRDKSGYYKWVIRKEFQIDMEAEINQPDYANRIDQYYFVEGRKSRRINTHYERNLKARRKCIEHYGYVCSICEFDFHEKYGEIGKEFIEVHHVNPIHEKQGEYEINPLKDLITVCSNCHSILHRRAKPIQIEELKTLIKTS